MKTSKIILKKNGKLTKAGKTFVKSSKGVKKSKCPPHSWDRGGERCIICGTKDWMT